MWCNYVLRAPDRRVVQLVYRLARSQDRGSAGGQLVNSGLQTLNIS